MENFYVSGHSVIGRRIAAYIIDCTIITILALILVYFFGGLISFSVVMPACFLFVLFKDIFSGRSPGKRLMGLKVIISGDVESVPSASKLILRNLLLIIWPIEAIRALSDRYGRRFGDNIAKTEVIGRLQYNKSRAVISIVLAVLIYMCSLLLFINQSIKSDPAYMTAVSYIENSGEIKYAVGDVKGFGFFISGSIDTFNDSGEADLKIPVHGTKKDITVEITLTKAASSGWNVEDVRF